MSRRIKWATGIGGSALILALFLGAIYRSYGPGPFDERVDRLARRWNAFTSPEMAPVIWRFVGQGLLITLQIAVISIGLSLIFGTLLALMRLARDRQIGFTAPEPVRVIVAAPAALIVQTIRASPLFMLILYTFIAAPKIGIQLGPKAAGIVALTIYTSSVLAEILRAGILSLERGQFEAASSLGLSYLKKLRFVILPQAMRRMVPAIVSQLVTLIKDTSLLAFITVLEVTRRLNILSQQQFNPIETSIVAASIYFVVNFTLSTVARRLELKPARVGGAASANIQSLGAEDQVLVATSGRAARR